MFFDTHCHLNFKSFDGRIEEVVESAKNAGVEGIVVPGTDVETSKNAVEIAKKFSNIYVAVGIHPHHVFEIYSKSSTPFFSTASPRLSGPQAIVLKKMSELHFLLENPKVIAIGEVGIDRHQYQKTRHKDYKIDEEFVELQKEFFVEQIKLARTHKKALIIHNREAKKDVLEILTTHSSLLTFNFVFHCCEPDEEILDFAKKHKMFIGVDGDVCYWRKKQEFIKKIPLEMLVLETDSPFLSPFRKFPNEPKNIPYIAELVAKLLNCQVADVQKQTTENAKRLFNLN